jgi:hypothetical protein
VVEMQAGSFAHVGIGAGAIGETQENVELCEREGLTEVGKKGSEWWAEREASEGITHKLNFFWFIF